ncbi:MULTISPECIES: hypothetical protein [unclassified Streptomyces]|uniref:hypothetical protein n=1 Tax=unclassified Streptomyces TaxID=2593676 RepID=UPI003D72553F
MDREEYVCPVCGQAVASAVRRHKTLGAWVPRWVPGPCRNLDCEAYEPRTAEHDRRHAREGERERPRERHTEPTPGTRGSADTAGAEDSARAAHREGAAG